MALNLAVKLKDRGHDVIIFGANERLVNKQFVEKYKSLGLPMTSIKDWRVVSFALSKVKMAFVYLKIKNKLPEKVKVRFVKSLINSYKVDLICSHAPSTDQICKDAVKRKQVPLFMVEHGLYSYFLSQGKQKKMKALPYATGVIAVSEFCKHQIKNYVNKSAEITTIYNGVEIESPKSSFQVRKELGIKEGEIAFGLVARGEPKKGWQHAIDAFLKLQSETDKKVHLILVGGSDYVDSLKQKYSSHNEIHFVGKKSNPTYYIDAIDVGLMLSMYQTEALSLSALEFLMLGKPVIVTNVGGVPEIFQHFNDAVSTLIDLEDDGTVNIGQIKTNMLSFVNGEKSLFVDPLYAELLRQKFSLDRCAAAYENLFQLTLSGKKLSQLNSSNLNEVPERKLYESIS